jgi:bifunctional DNase/RNase
MKKIGLDIVGLSYSQTQSGAYALVLSEQEGSRRLPIIIGGFEAQAIAIELEDMTPSRPLTHDIFKSFADSFEIKINEIIIYNLVEGIFYAKLICEKDGITQEIDTRTSDAVAIAVRFKCPIFTYEFILNNAGIILEESESSEETGLEKAVTEELIPEKKEKPKQVSLADLQNQLQEAIDTEDYEMASKIRDEINKRTENNN